MPSILNPPRLIAGLRDSGWILRKQKGVEAYIAEFMDLLVVDNASIPLTYEITQECPAGEISVATSFALPYRNVDPGHAAEIFTILSGLLQQDFAVPYEMDFQLTSSVDPGDVRGSFCCSHLRFAEGYPLEIIQEMCGGLITSFRTLVLVFTPLVQRYLLRTGEAAAFRKECQQIIDLLKLDPDKLGQA